MLESFCFSPQSQWQDHYPHLSSYSGMLNWYPKDCIQGRPRHGHTFLFADTDRKRTIGSGKTEAWSSGGAVLVHTTGNLRTQSPFSSCSHKIILCNTKTMTGLKLRKLYGFIYVLYMHISSPFLLDSGSSFQCKQPLFRSQCLWLLLQSNPAKPLLQQSKFFFISVIPTTPKLNLIRQ